jgi:hypothetical protein
MFAIASAIVIALTVLLYGIYRGGWLEGVLAGIALGMSMLPEEFPVVLTVFLAMARPEPCVATRSGAVSLRSAACRRSRDDGGGSGGFPGVAGTVEIPVAPSLACPSPVARMEVCLDNG